MKITVSVSVDGLYYHGNVNADVPELLHQAWEPIAICDEPIMAAITGSSVADSVGVRDVMKVRDHAAKILAEKIASCLIEQMGQNDTHNGYKKEDLI